MEARLKGVSLVEVDIPEGIKRRPYLQNMGRPLPPNAEFG